MFAEFVINSGRKRSVWAADLGISRSFLSEIMSGKRRPGLDLAVRIERITAGEVPASSWVPENSTSSEDAA